MPLVRRKKVLLHPIPPSLPPQPPQPAPHNPTSSSSNGFTTTQLQPPHPNPSVFYLERTGEIFTDFESYSARMAFYKMNVFMCEVTGKGNLDYFQALESERVEAITVQARFPDQLKAAVLSSVQWQIQGRLDGLVELVHDRFKDRYFKGEKVFVDVQGEKYYARIINVFPPKTHSHSASSSSSAQSHGYHSVGTSLSLSLEDSLKRDDPMAYFYAIRIIEEAEPGSEAGPSNPIPKLEGPAGGEAREKWASSEMEVKADVLSRDRLSFSKSILKRFIRESVDRDASIASPWTVKPAIAERYGIATEMSDEARKRVDGAKKGEKEKRKKLWDDKHESEPSKKKRKLDEKARLAAERAEQLAREKEEKEQEKAALAAAARARAKAKAIKYPTEDLNVPHNKRGSSKPVRRPAFDRTIPFGSSFERFLMTWNFMTTFGKPLNLSTFTLDEYEHALRHALPEYPCTLISEIHNALIFAIKERGTPPTKHAAVISLMEDSGEMDESEEQQDGLLGAMADFGNEWDKKVLKEKDGRKGWEEVLIGLLKDYATVETFPTLRQVLTNLLFTPSSSSRSTSSSSPPPQLNLSLDTSELEPATPSSRYALIPPEDKIAIIAFLCDLCMSNKSVHAFIDNSEAQLTELRKQKVEVGREKKKYLEDIASIKAKIEPDAEASATAVANEEEATNGTSTPTPAPTPPNTNGRSSRSRRSSPGPVSSTASEVDTASEASAPTRSRPQRRKSEPLATAKQRAAARNKAAETKALIAECRRLDEEVNKCERKLEGIERDFRKLVGIGRAKPMGKDRFYNSYWWLDGLGGGGLVGGGGVAQYGTGRLFVQGPNEIDLEVMMNEKGEEVAKKRLEMEGEDEMLATGEWACYAEVEDLDEFSAWLEEKGHRELALKKNLTKWWDHITSGMKKRNSDLSTYTRPAERRSLRARTSASDALREPYMLWTNRKAVANPTK